MNCPHCDVQINDHEASPCMDLWVMQDVFGWTTSIVPYKGDFYPEGSYFVIWHQPDDFLPGICMIISQAFDKDGNNLRSNKDNPLGIWDETAGYDYSLAFSTDMVAAKKASDKAGKAVIFAPHSSVRDGCYANRKKEWLVEIIPHGGTTGDAIWAYGKTEEIARCRAAIKVKGNSR